MAGAAPEPVRVLIVEDNDDDAALMRRALEREGLHPETRVVASGPALREALERFRPDIVLSDYSLPGFAGREALALAREAAPSTPFIFVSGTLGEETAVECLREGATDYVLKERMRRLGPAVRRALEEARRRGEYESRIRYLANYDALTGLANRSLLADRATQALAHVRRTQRPAALLALDIDQFSLLNESLGNAAGDAILVEVAARLKRSVHEGDTVARLGADHFAVLVADLERAEDIYPIARRVQESVGAPLALGGRELHLSASIGAALYPGDGAGADFETLMRNAGTAVRRVKAQGRGGFRYYAAGMTAEAAERIELEMRLQLALRRSEIALAYQPEVSVKTRRIVGVEALMRWTPHGGEPVPPTRFIAVAEASGQIHALGQWALAAACAAAGGWRTRGGRAVLLAVNVSPRQLAAPEFPDLVERTLRAAAFDPAGLELEITESALMASGGAGHEALARLKALGLTLTIDDFGTGYSNLSYLSRLPIDRLKVDASFVRRMLEDPRDAAIVQAVVLLGQGLGLRVAAEGVETPEQLAMLGEMGCDEAQGQLFSRPLDAAGFGALLERQNKEEAWIPSAPFS